MGIEIGKTTATRVLERLGFDVEKVPVGNGRTADLLAIDSESQQYLIEVKDKVESESKAQERIERLRRGDPYVQADQIAQDNRISGILQDARKQLDATPKNDTTFQLIWFHATGVDAGLKYRQAFATFYGQVDLLALNPLSNRTRVCFYFDYSTAFNVPSIDGLILTDGENLQLCLNEFSAHGDEFRRSELYRKLIESGGVVDPVVLEAEGAIISCRAAIARKNDDEIVKALQEQTGVLYSPIRFTRHAVSIATNCDED